MENEVFAVEMRGISKSFGKVRANDHVDLKLKKGEILALLGENGSGKTTLMNMLSGIYYQDEGEVFVDGCPVSIRSPKDAFAHGIGMVHQHYLLVNVFTAAENIVLGTKIKGSFSNRKVNEQVQEIVDRYGFDLDPKKKIYDMSVAEKQTVEIVKVLYRGAKILILDEPTAV
ncbi:MAG: ATP-binding cassette domain-containing protein, partial [Lachnospiraceae bacterium]|nr:ATP-binding cassette domain-containing protein [Lachnospiraceae bacterium]